MINALLSGLIDFATNSISWFLSPIDNLITQYLPDLSSSLNSISSLFSMGLDKVGWFVDASFLYPSTIGIIATIGIARLTISPLVSLIKNLVHWWDSIVA